MESRKVRFTIRTLLLLVAFCALLFTVAIQTVRLQQARAREQQLRVEAEWQRAQSETYLAAARNALNQARAGSLPQNGRNAAPDRAGASNADGANRQPRGTQP